MPRRNQVVESPRTTRCSFTVKEQSRAKANPSHDTTRPCCFPSYAYSVAALSPLHLLLEPLHEFRQGSAAVGDLVLLCLWHLGVRLAFVLKARVPALKVLVLGLVSRVGEVEVLLTKISRSTSFHDRALNQLLALL